MTLKPFVIIALVIVIALALFAALDLSEAQLDALFITAGGLQL